MFTNLKSLSKFHSNICDDVKVIKSIRITGDFFLYPEEALDQLESLLIGMKIDRHSIKETIENALQKCEAFGFDSESLTDAILGCLKP